MVEELDRRAWRTKQWTTRRGYIVGDMPFDKITLYRLLMNPAYLGKVKHHDDLYEGERPGVCEPVTIRW